MLTQAAALSLTWQRLCCLSARHKGWLLAVRIPVCWSSVWVVRLVSWAALATLALTHDRSLSTCYANFSAALQIGRLSWRLGRWRPGPCASLWHIVSNRQTIRIIVVVSRACSFVAFVRSFVSSLVRFSRTFIYDFLTPAPAKNNIFSYIFQI